MNAASLAIDLNLPDCPEDKIACFTKHHIEMVRERERDRDGGREGGRERERERGSRENQAQEVTIDGEEVEEEKQGGRGG